MKIEIDDKLFKTKPIFYVNCTPEEMEKDINKYTKADLTWLKEEDRVSGTVLFFEGNAIKIVYIRNFEKNDPESISTFVHELTHLVIRICEDKGIAITSSLPDGRVNDEPVAYMMDYFTREFLEKYNKKAGAKK
jgi:hypothetical protein